MKIPIEVSARHLHLSQKDLETLFGEGYELTKFKDLTQLSDFAAEEFLTVKLGDREIKNIRIVGPVRNETQVELSLTDSLVLGIKSPVRISGDIQGTPGISLKNEKNGNEISLEKGVIVSHRHIHCNPKEAEELETKNGDMVSVKVEGDRGLIFENVAVRVGEKYKLSMHIDTDEANSAGIDKKSVGFIV